MLSNGLIAFVEGRSCGEYIVYNEDVLFVLESCWLRPECAGYISGLLLDEDLSLGLSVSYSFQGGWALGGSEPCGYLPSDNLRLVVAPLEAAERVEGNGDYKVHIEEML